MNLVELIVIICSLANPGACSEKHFLFQSHGSLKACMMEAPPYLAQMMAQYPDQRVSRWRCVWPDKAEGNA